MVKYTSLKPQKLNCKTLDKNFTYLGHTNKVEEVCHDRPADVSPLERLTIALLLVVTKKPRMDVTFQVTQKVVFW